jgi:hypothetical protein
MKTFRNYIWIFFICFFSRVVVAQELKCNVVISTEQLKSTANGSYLDKAYVTEIQNAISQFINSSGNKWTNDRFRDNEKIVCNIMINITEIPAQYSYKANAQIQCSRPVYGSSYESLLLNYVDQNFDFTYQPGQQMIYNENSYSDNLTALCAFYSYIFLGLDYDSFSKMGGNPHFEKAQKIVNGAQQASEAGWQAFQSQQNRYWLNENLNNAQMQPIRECSYIYHRLALDEFTQDPAAARAKVLDVLTKIKKVNDIKPATILIRSFFNAKENELIGIFVEGTPEERQKAYDILRSVDPTKATKYEKILKSN